MIVALPDSAVLAAWVNLLRARARWGPDRKATIQLGKNKLEIKGMQGERGAEPIMRWLGQHAGK